MTDIDERLRVLSVEPLNAETSLPHHRGVITPRELIYHRNHFPFPERSSTTISVGGKVQRTLELREAHILSMPTRSLLVTMECAGNGRIGFSPPAEGEPWEYGAVSTAEWSGVPLVSILDAAGLDADVVEIVIEGADRGFVEAAGGEIPFTRSLPLEKARDPDVILAHTLNSEPIGLEHGAYRLVVPGWYGMASVKWVQRIEAVSEPFRGFYQVDRYVMPGPHETTIPLGTMRVRSHIVSHGPGGQVTPHGQVLIRGYAWSGEAPIVRVEVSTDVGETWADAHLASREERYAWRRWEYLWNSGPGPRETVLMCRARDALGNTQPDQPEWNRLGYANNAVQRVPVSILASH